MPTGYSLELPRVSAAYPEQDMGLARSRGRDSNPPEHVDENLNWYAVLRVNVAEVGTNSAGVGLSASPAPAEFRLPPRPQAN